MIQASDGLGAPPQAGTSGESIVRNTKLLTLAAGLLLAGMLIPAGCSDAKARESARKLLDAVDVARRLCAKAISQMSTSPIKADGQYLPLDRVVRGEPAIALSPPLAVNPEAWASLQAAEKGLAAAMRDYAADAGADTEALANTAMGDILMLKAEYKLAASAADRRDARDSLTLGLKAASMVHLYAGLVRYHEQLGTLSDKDVLAMQSAAQQDASQTQSEIAAIQQEIASLTGQITTLQSANDQMLPKVRDLRLDAQRAGGQKGLPLLDQALRMEEQINANVSAMAAHENALELRQTALADKQLALADAQGRGSVAEAAVEARKGLAESDKQVLGELKASQAKAKTDAQEYASRLSRLCGALTEAESEALDACQAAAKRFMAVKRAEARDGAVTARAADAYWAAAELHSQSLQLRARNLQFAEQLAWAWSDREGSPRANGADAPAANGEGVIAPAPDIAQAIPFARGLLAYAPNPESIYKQAVEAYQQAADLYASAARMTDPQLRWAYQGQAAAAYIALYNLTGGDEPLAEARATLDSALEGKRNAEYLRPVVALEKMLPPRPAGSMPVKDESLPPADGS